MKYVAAYLLATLGGKTEPSAEDIKNILQSVGAQVEDEPLNKLLSELKGKNIEEIIAAGKGKLASVPSASSVAVSGAPQQEEKKEEEKEEEKKEEKEESASGEDMGFGLFGDDDD